MIDVSINSEELPPEGQRKVYLVVIDHTGRQSMCAVNPLGLEWFREEDRNEAWERCWKPLALAMHRYLTKKR